MCAGQSLGVALGRYESSSIGFTEIDTSLAEFNEPRRCNSRPSLKPCAAPARCLALYRNTGHPED